MTCCNDRILGAGALALGLVLSTPARAADTEPGTWWEQTVEMSMAGMAMPPQTQKVCVPKKGMEEPPGASKDERCKVTEMKKVGPKMSWKMECTEPERMTGEGEITQGKDGYTGSMAMHSSQGDMNVKLRGKKVGGDCDAGALKKQVAAIQKQQQDAQAQHEKGMEDMCAKSAEEMHVRMFSGITGMCKKPEQVAKLCANLGTRKGYTTFAGQARQDREAARIVEKLCSKDPETVRSGLCAKAAKETKGDKTPSDVLAFLTPNCPDETRALAKKECAGRDFTGMPDEWRDLCVKYAREELSKDDVKPAKDEEEPKTPKDQAVDKAKGVLKGLFGK